MTWYILLLECIIVLWNVYSTYHVPSGRILTETLFCVIGIGATRYLTKLPSEKCADLFQGAATMTIGMIVYLIYSLESGSDRMLPVCMFFLLAECTMYKNIQLNIYVTFMNIFATVITMALSGVGVLSKTYSRIEFAFIMLLLLIASGLMLFMQTKDLFTDRVAREDEKSLDDLLSIVEMKCEDATAAAEAKSSFLANMSHEIRTPINAVLGMNEMILREAEEEDIRGYAQNIQSAGTSLLSLINDILDISKIESGKMELVPEQYQLGSLLYDIILVVQARLEKKHLSLILDIDENIPGVLYGDEVRIRQIITNVLTNAVKYTEKGSVTFRVHMDELPDGEDGRPRILLKVAVKDTGMGIKESKEVLFASFQRGRDLRAHHIEGTGLGLSITQQLLTMMGSDLEMESEYGKGSEFSFELAQTVVDAAPMGNLNDLYKKKLDQEQRYQESFIAPEAKVLVVDDNLMNQTVVKSLLKKTLVQIDMASDGIQCLEKCANRRYDLILMDHLMPNMDGIEAFHALRADKKGANSRTPVIILTANAVSGMKQKYLDEGFNGFLSKPVQAQLLEETLKLYLPKELVTLSEGGQDEDEEEKERQKILRQTIENLGLADLDFDDALQYSSGTVADVLENIRGYLSDSAKNCECLKEFFGGMDLDNYKIHAHALKSTSRVIGAVHMAHQAELMEKAAADGDRSYIEENFASLLQEHDQLADDLERLLAAPGIREFLPQETVSAVSMEQYQSDVQMFLQQVQDYDVDFEGLRQFCRRYPENKPMEEQRSALEAAAEDFDYERIEQTLQGIQELLTVEA